MSGKEESFSQYYNEEMRKPRDFSKVKCYNCNEYGHYALHCRKRDQRQQRREALNLVEEDLEPTLLMASTSFNKTQRKSRKDIPTNKSIWFAKDYDHEDSKFREIILEEDEGGHDQDYDKLKDYEATTCNTPVVPFNYIGVTPSATIWTPCRAKLRKVAAELCLKLELLNHYQQACGFLHIPSLNVAQEKSNLHGIRQKLQLLQFLNGSSHLITNLSLNQRKPSSVPLSPSSSAIDGSIYTILKHARFGSHCKKIRVDEDLHDLRYVETEFPSIVINDIFASQNALPYESKVSTPINNGIDFRISFEESDDEDYAIICDKNLFSYKLISVNDLKSDSENDNYKVNMPSFPSPKPTVNFLTEPTVSPQRIDEFNLKDETYLSECDEEEQNVLNFNDLFPFNVIYPNDLKSDKDNDDDKVDIKHSLWDLSVKPLPDVINTDDGAYTHTSNKLLETSHDTSNKFFKTETFVKGLNFNIMT
ncbi:retrovirus-related pol polyprotein from transposon TNT 1-94 [Tanacetum coccineum]